MPEMKKNDEGRLSVEFLRLLSFFVEYLNNSFLYYVMLSLGLTMYFLSLVFFLSDLIINFLFFLGLYTTGAFLFTGAFVFIWRSRRRFKRYLFEVSQPTLIKSSEYESLVKDMQDRFEKQYVLTLADTEKQLMIMQDRLVSLQKERDQLERQIKELKKKKGG